VRKILEAIALIALLGLWAMTAYAFYGPHGLPDRIATHFDLSGRPNAWGGPHMLLVLPCIATVLYTLMSLVSRFPARFNSPYRVTSATRPRMEAITLNMIAWLKAETLCLFGWIQHASIRSATEAQNALSPLFVPVMLVVVFATIAAHFMAMRRAARGTS
jgi:uncharacterized membrane protein